MSTAIVKTITAMRERPKLLLACFICGLGLFVLYDFFAARHGAHFAGDNIRGFWAMFAFGGALFMTKFMKGLWGLFLGQPLDYWTRDEGGEG